MPAAIVIFIMVTISWWSLDTGHKVGGLFSDISNITEIDAVGKNTISSLKLSDEKLAKGITISKDFQSGIKDRRKIFQRHLKRRE